MTLSAFKCSPMDLSLFAGLAHQSSTSKKHIKKKHINKSSEAHRRARGATKHIKKTLGKTPLCT